MIRIAMDFCLAWSPPERTRKPAAGPMLASKRRRFLVPRLFRLVTIGFLVTTLSFVGCYRRSVAPEVKYNEDDVKLLEKELEKMDWE
jgi:hypothetical protein